MISVKQIKLYLPLIIVVVVVGGMIFFFESLKVKPSTLDLTTPRVTPITENSPAPNDATQTRLDAKALKYSLAPELIGISGYLNTKEGTTISQFLKEGKVVLIDFWTYTCINCIRTLPYLKQWDDTYRDQGLVIIGVHTPEFSFEKEYDNVQAAINKHNIKYAIVQDNDYATWNAFKNRYWPRKYLIDSDGFIRYDHIGEGGYVETENMIRLLLEEQGGLLKQQETNLELSQPKLPLTPELYAGHRFALGRGQNIGNSEGLQPNKQLDYKLPETIKPNIIYLNGQWLSNEDDLQAKGEGSVFLDFTAFEVNIVANNLKDPVKMEVFIDGPYITKSQAGSDIQFEGGKGFVEINEPRLYNLVDGNYKSYKLELRVTKDFTFNAFTFG